MHSVLPFLALVALSAHALPANSTADLTSLYNRQREGVPRCLTAQETSDAVEIYRKLIAEYAPELGEAWVSEAFVEYSDSINTLAHLPLGGPTFPNKAAFLQSQAVTPPFPIQILSVDAVQCDTVALQWTASFGAANLPSKGHVVLRTVWENDRWRLRQINVEFNSLIWLLNTGGSYSWEGVTYTPDKPDSSLVPKPAV